MDRTIVIQLAAQAGFGANQRTTLLAKLVRFADLVIKYCAANQEDQARRWLEFTESHTLEEIRELADAGELGKYLPAFEMPARIPRSGFKLEELEPLDLRPKKK